MFHLCVVGNWAVRRGLSLSESDSRLVCSKVTLAAHVGSCMLPSGRDGDTVYVVKRCRSSQFGWRCRVLCTLCPRAVHVVYVCVRGPSESRRVTVNHRVVWHIVLTFAVLDVCFLCVFMAVVAVCCETLATRLYLGSFGFWQLARRHVCLSLSSWVCFCHC